MMEAVAEFTKVTCFFKVTILRLIPAQNQQGLERSHKPQLIVGESEVEQTINWPSPTPGSYWPGPLTDTRPWCSPQPSLTLPRCKMAMVRAGTSLLPLTMWLKMRSWKE